MNLRFSLSIALLSICFFVACSQEYQQINIISEELAGKKGHLPYLVSDQTGNIFLSWVETDSTTKKSTLLYSAYDVTGWQKPDTIASSTDWFVNWADYPTIVADSGYVKAAHVLKKIPGNTYSYNINVYRNSGKNEWSEPLTPHIDSTATEHGFASFIPFEEKVLGIWLDGRKTANRSEEEYFDLNKAMTLRAATIHSEGSVSSRHIIDEAVCDCCNTSLAITGNGAIAAYRGRSGQEIRDIFVSRFDGTQWSPPNRVYEDNWNIAACPVNGPAIAARGSTVVVAWYTGANQERLVKAAFSTDYGNTFTDPLVLNESEAIGRVDAGMTRDNVAIISWMERKGERAELRVQALRPDGTQHQHITIADIAPSRSSGFPQLALGREHLFVAWTHIDSTNTSVRTARISNSALTK